MFERFTDRARRVVVLAQEEARMLDHNYIGTEHLLLGLIHEGEGVAAKALESLGISLEAVRQQVEEIIGRGQQAPSGHIPFTPRAKKVLELSLREAMQLGHDYIGTEHILLGLIREGDGVAAQVLVKLGADLNRVRQQVIQLLQDYQGEDVTGEGSGLGSAARRLPGDALAQAESLDSRLAAIERWVGMRPDLDDLDQEIARVRREKEAAVDRQDYEAAAALRDQEKQLLAARADRDKDQAVVAQVRAHGRGDGYDPVARFGRRTGWYALVRALKPRVVVETGVEKGLGAMVLCAALLRNAKGGHLGRYYGTDIDPSAGLLLCEPYRSMGKILYGNSIESLQALAPTVDLFINDSDHSPEYEAREYRTIAPKLSERAIIIGDNAHITDELLKFSRETSRRFLFFREEPANHWYLGAGMGLSFPTALL